MASYHPTSALLIRGRWRDLPQLKWACVRLLIQAYIYFCFFSVIGGGLTYPLATYIFLGDARFWRYLRLGPKLYLFLLRGAWLIMRSGGHAFLFSVPLTDPPTSKPHLSNVHLKATWPHGKSCGNCTACCDVIRCPIADRENGQCMGYDSMYWRYFNCGRFPISQEQLEFYGCPKWEMS